MSTFSLPEPPATLPPHYLPALEHAIAHIDATFDPLAIVVSGSILRGNPDPGSDFDIHVLWSLPQRRRIQLRFDGVPAEIFLNPPAWLARYLQDEAQQGRPLTADMLASGWLIRDRDGQMQTFIEMARHQLAAGWQVSADTLQRMRYEAALLFEDAAEVFVREPYTARLLQASAIEAGLRCWFAGQQRFLPRPKQRLAMLADAAPKLHALLIEAMQASTDHAPAATLALARALIGAEGFFCWDSGDQP
ncbi:hypothetical protein SAMN02745857_02451 [Andreprevotia lacus DSM 23236]|jgi:hypothetical protein|uniref:Nucleotidyltransferase domain-containing protein n=1 Tax=Andreprevotia lacus DSM 23236 TaxID=1121001 RepID=A0A1W1XQT8_9NEIS|nr:hypothetical protein [Andreprevotia lacus]SMC26323.1 hypothetical protein SAMN02745857_02451 [Andreprevotia lacus DSM 23236]